MFLVTGGAGFIGSHTAAALIAQGLRVRVLDDLCSGSLANLVGLDVEFHEGSVADSDAVGRAMQGCTEVVHLAALPSVPGSCRDPVAYDLVNVHGAVVVFEAARRAGVRRVVYASSSAVYGASELLPKREDQSIDAQSPYAAAKAANEIYAATFSRTLGLECVGLRYFNVFGPRQDPNGPYAAVIPRFVEMALGGTPLPIFGDGEQGRDFVSVHDVARANLLAARVPGLGGRVYNIGGGRMMSVNQLAHHVSTVVGGVSVAHQPERPGDVRYSMADISRATNELGWRPEADFDAAMAETIRWYRERLAIPP